jgi:hypothetical protein
MREMRRIGVALAVWIVAVLLLWLGGGLGLRPSVVLSLVIALILDQVISVQRFLSEPKESQGVLWLRFEADLGLILLDLGIIDEATNWSEISALYQPDPQSRELHFPTYRESCEWIPDAKVFFWPSRSAHQSRLDLGLFLQLPSECPLAKTYVKREPSFSDDTEKAYCQIRFFIEGHKFGVRVPQGFVDARLASGGLGNACLESNYVFDCGQFDLVVGNLPYSLFRPACKGFSDGERERYSRVLENRKAYFESCGWALEGHEEPEVPTTRGLEIAKHKYMQIEIFNREH